jgi:hypothetical protein
MQINNDTRLGCGRTCSSRTTWVQIRLMSLVVLVCLSGGWGCRDTQTPRLAVSGTITLDRQPLGSVLVTFVPTTAGQRGCSVEAVDGQFETTVDTGLSAGQYAVVVSPLEPELEEYEARRTAGEKKLLNTVAIPAQYLKPSDLLVEVVAKEENRLTLELSSR